MGASSTPTKRLRRQSGGFEGVVELVGTEATDHDSVSKSPAISALGLHLNSVPAHKVSGPALNDVFTSVDQLVDLDSHGLPRFQELPYQTQDLIRSSGDPAPLTEGRRAVEFEVRAQVAPPLVPIAAIPGVPGSPNDLHVLPRHAYSRSPAASRAGPKSGPAPSSSTR